jgi:Concanavalin A-like lectin/glucanases superfamily
MSFDLDGVDDYLVSGNRTNGYAHSVCFWVDPDVVVTSGQLVWHGNNWNQHHFYVGWDSTPRIRLYRITNNTPGDYRMTTPFSSIPGWKFVAIVSDGWAESPPPPTFYVWDGVTYPVLTKLTWGAGIDGTAQFGGAYGDGGAWHLGIIGYGGGQPFDGRLAEVSIWEARLLTDAEVAAIFTLGVPAIGGATDYLPLDVGSLPPQNFGYSGETWGVAGTTLAPNPPTRPAGRRG